MQYLYLASKLMLLPVVWSEKSLTNLSCTTFAKLDQLILWVFWYMSLQSQDGDNLQSTPLLLLSQLTLLGLTSLSRYTCGRCRTLWRHQADVDGHGDEFSYDYINVIKNLESRYHFDKMNKNTNRYMQMIRLNIRIHIWPNSTYPYF